MKTPQEPKPDEPLRHILRKWEVESPLPLGFEATVFRRIEQSQRQIAQTLWKRLELWFSRALAQPAVATLIIAAFVTVGLTAGWTVGGEEAARAKAELGERYLRMVTPQPSSHTAMK